MTALDKIRLTGLLRRSPAPRGFSMCRPARPARIGAAANPERQESAPPHKIRPRGRCEHGGEDVRTKRILGRPRALRLTCAATIAAAAIPVSGALAARHSAPRAGHASGAAGAVTVTRDSAGIPHIVAGN